MKLKIPFKRKSPSKTNAISKETVVRQLCYSPSAATAVLWFLSSILSAIRVDCVSNAEQTHIQVDYVDMMRILLNTAALLIAARKRTPSLGLVWSIMALHSIITINVGSAYIVGKKMWLGEVPINGYTYLQFFNLMSQLILRLGLLFKIFVLLFSKNVPLKRADRKIHFTTFWDRPKRNSEVTYLL